MWSLLCAFDTLQRWPIIKPLSSILQTNFKRSRACKDFSSTTMDGGADPWAFVIRQTKTKLKDPTLLGEADRVVQHEILPLAREDETFVGMMRLYNQLDGSYIIQTRWLTYEDDLERTSIASEYHDMAAKKLVEVAHSPEITYFDGKQVGSSSTELEEEDFNWGEKTND
mmetsp:Transcript_31010/g.53587  ORF Transcript_31010/g.53587 Transcript_31010/m.53587 type:complete len:169 (+) Transcript_31010:191-697(+)